MRGGSLNPGRLRRLYRAGRQGGIFGRSLQPVTPQLPGGSSLQTGFHRRFEFLGMALQRSESLSLAQQLIMTPQLPAGHQTSSALQAGTAETVSQEMEANPILEENPPEEADYDPNSEEVSLSAEAVAKPTRSRPRAMTVTGKATWRNTIPAGTTRFMNTGRPLRWRARPPAKPSLPPPHVPARNEPIQRHPAGDRHVHHWKPGWDGYLKATIEEIIAGHGPERRGGVGDPPHDPELRPGGGGGPRHPGMPPDPGQVPEFGGTVIERILQEYMDRLETKRYDLIAKGLSISLDDVLSAVSVITGWSETGPAVQRG